MVTRWTPADFGFKFEDVALVTDDGVDLSAWFIPSADGEKEKAVVLCHGYPADKGNILGLAPLLQPHYNLLFFDFRAMGNSGGKATTLGYREIKDLKSAVDYLKGRGIQKVGVYGFSMGGAVAIMSENPDVSAVVSESAFSDINLVIDQIYGKFGVFKYPFIYLTKIYAGVFLGVDLEKNSPRMSIARLNIPVLLIHSEDDATMPVEHARILSAANPEAALWVVRKADHGATLNDKEYGGKITGFFRDNL